jgi:hypothetical protein
MKEFKHSWDHISLMVALTLLCFLLLGRHAWAQG